jgi:hypothetical protein
VPCTGAGRPPARPIGQPCLLAGLPAWSQLGDQLGQDLPGQSDHPAIGSSIGTRQRPRHTTTLPCPSRASRPANRARGHHRSRLFRSSMARGSVPPCSASRARPRGNLMARPARLPPSRIVLGVVGLLVFLLVIAGSTGGGLLVGLAVLGLALLLIGVGVAIVRRARWAFYRQPQGRRCCGSCWAGHARGGRRHRSVDCARRRPGLLGREARRSVAVKIWCWSAPLNRWHPSPVRTSDPGLTWSG